VKKSGEDLEEKSKGEGGRERGDEERD
jgi:hypothetical protein